MSVKKNDKHQETESLDVEKSPSLKSWGEPADLPKNNVVIECGWGRLIFAHTIKSSKKIAELLREEEDGKRDLALYVREPQVVVANDPQGLFIDPSYTYRLSLKDYKAPRKKKGPFSIRRLHATDNTWIIAV